MSDQTLSEREIKTQDQRIGQACLIVSSIEACMHRNIAVPFRPLDVSIYLVAALGITAVSLCAMTLPALSATRFDPMQSLRNE